MAISEKQKQWRNAWDSKNMTVLGCKIRKEKAEEFKAACASGNTSVNAVFLSAIEQFMHGFTVANGNGKTVVPVHGSTVVPVHGESVQPAHGRNVQAEQAAQQAPEPQQVKKPPKGYPFTVELPQYLNERCKARYNRTHTDPKAFVLQALEAYSRGVSERNSFLLLFGGMESDGFTLEQVQAAAQAAGIDVGTWIREAIKDKI